MFYLLRLIFYWTIWFILADKRRWKEIFPACIFGSFLNLLLSVIMQYFPYWSYPAPGLHTLITVLADNFAIYPVQYIFLFNGYPKNNHYGIYSFTGLDGQGIAIVAEFIQLQTGNMTHLNGWML